MVSETVILDVIVEDGQIIEKQEQSRKNSETTSLPDAPEFTSPPLEQDASDEQKQTNSAGTFQLGLLFSDYLLR